MRHPLAPSSLLLALAAALTCACGGGSSSTPPTPAPVAVSMRPTVASLVTGGTQSFGFQANYSGSNPAPTGFTLNGQPCVIAP